MSYKPIKVSCEGKEQIAVFAQVKRLAERHEVLRSHQILQHMPAMAMLFTCEGKLLQSNVLARSYYQGSSSGEVEGWYHVKDRPIELRDIFNTIQWEDEAMVRHADIIRDFVWYYSRQV